MAWIKNTGKQPVDDDVMVRVIFNNRQIHDAIRASDWYWELHGSDWSIAEYEVVENP